MVILLLADVHPISLESSHVCPCLDKVGYWTWITHFNMHAAFPFTSCCDQLSFDIMYISPGLRSEFISHCQRKRPVPRCFDYIWEAHLTTSRMLTSMSWPGRQKATQEQTSASSCGTPSCSQLEKCSQQHTSRR